jgi:outer membrane lipoprotein-sorting protein
MILPRKRERALLSVSLALLVISCRAQSDSVATPGASPETVISSTPPFQTKEPNRYHATRTIIIVTAAGETTTTKSSIARDGELRRNESELAARRVAYLDLPEGRFVLLLDDKVYAAVAGEVSEDTTEETSPERLLHTDDGNTSYQKIGTEQIGGRNTSKYRIVVNSSNAGNVSLSETLMWIDEALQMPVKSEIKSSDGTRVMMELSDIKLDVDKSLFRIPEDYEKVTFSEFRKRLTKTD